MFCGQAGSLSAEHVIPKWLRKSLQIQQPVREFRGTAYAGAAETLAVVFHEVCTGCNNGWMEKLESATRPILEPMLLGAAPGSSRVLDPDHQALLATWAAKTALLLTLAKYRGQNHGWVPDSTLQWLAGHSGSQMPPPGTRVWMGGLDTSDTPAWMQTATLYGADGGPDALCVTFSAGCVVFQVFITGQQDPVLAPDIETWLQPEGPHQQALLQIAPSSSPVRWPPGAVFGTDDLTGLAGRLRSGLAPAP